jgi:hypothetical protein
MTDPAAIWKAEADTLRRIVMEALGEFEESGDVNGCPLDHWSNRARVVLRVP